ncbi:MAG TPA: putative glycoside hydrolase [Gemmatimonadaceae bacterium]|nr:putative glycoside hydrolase [Gemmatimonadaceae bacterium]
MTSAPRDTNTYPVIRGLYLNRFAPQSARKMHHLFAIADSTEINAFVIDMKDEFGLNYRSSKPEVARNFGDGQHGHVANVKALIDSVKAHGLVPIARLVAFKDPVAANNNPDWTIRREDSSAWRDKQGLAWVNAFDKRVWEYNLAVAEELVGLGFEEIQWDYIRFPEPYKSLPTQVFPGATTSKAEALAAFLRESNARLDKHGVRTTADIFGLVTTVRGTLEVGQNWEKLSPVTDVLLPMVYPSHYPRGSLGVERPNAQPYDIIKIALDSARARDEKLGITKAEHVRPWLQAFSIGEPKYGPEQITAQKKAVYDAGYHGWILWSPGSMYDPFVPALDKKKPADAVSAGR